MNKEKISFILAIFILFVIVFAGLAADWLSPYNPLQPDIINRLQPPNLEHLLGTDALGRDMLSRILYGSRYSIFLSLLSTLLALFIGTCAGMAAGFYGKRIDFGITLLSNIFEGIPGTCFMIAIAGVLGPSLSSLLLALAITSWAGFSRIVRAEVLKIKTEPFIEGLIILGCSDCRLIFNHFLPNIFHSLVVLAALRIGRGVLAVAGLSFLGLGVQPPIPDWSVMINDSVLYYRTHPHLVLVPGLCIVALVYSINVISEYLKKYYGEPSNEVTRW